MASFNVVSKNRGSPQFCTDFGSMVLNLEMIGNDGSDTTNDNTQSTYVDLYENGTLIDTNYTDYVMFIFFVGPGEEKSYGNYTYKCVGKNTDPSRYGGTWSISQTFNYSIFPPPDTSGTITVDKSFGNDDEVQISSSGATACPASPNNTIYYRFNKTPPSGGFEIVQDYTNSTSTVATLNEYGQYEFESFVIHETPKSEGIGAEGSNTVTITREGEPSASLAVSNSDSDLDVSADASSSSHPEGEALTYDYDWGDGTTDTNAGSSASHTYSSNGDYTVTVTVTDTSSNSDTATDTAVAVEDPTASLTVTDSNNDLTANADATGSSSNNGGSLTYDYDWGDGTSSNSAGSAENHTYSSGGSYVVTLTVTDTYGNTAIDTDTVVAGNPNSAPTIDSFSASADNNGEIKASASFSASDPDGDSLSYEIDWGDGSTTNSSSGTHQYSSLGSYTVTFTADDGTDTDTATDTVSITNPMSWGGSSPFLEEFPGGEVQFNNYFVFEHRDPNIGYFDDGGSPLTWEYDWGDGTIENSYFNDTHTYNSSGFKNVTVTVTDTNLGIDFVTNLSINVEGIPEVSLTVTNGDNDLDIVASANGSDIDGQSLDYDYDWGDGTTDFNAGTTENHIYSSAGTYRVEVTVEDTDGNTNDDIEFVDVTNPNSPPNASLNVTQV